MTTDTRHGSLPRGLQLRSSAASVGHFLWHLLQMVLAMEIGMAVYHLHCIPWDHAHRSRAASINRSAPPYAGPDPVAGASLFTARGGTS
jgi:hypothetical protein